ncbi:TonB-dependent receptor [Steroidobacter sp.]|uniref:TonB-dependent receptor n=1 Tax=Steroidobacter sp. TaxID=1978227 RepID=UPI001A5B05BF|nr:TonB-dependent receptor [Steroidobacter sp.]MBL8270280.1 TonB-dependent receptor [Steroidobacter sp.]
MDEKIMKSSGALATACALVLTSAAHAASDAPATTDILEEVVVSARMRDEDLRDVPISIVAIGADALAQRGATELRNLGDVVPNVIIGTSNQERRTNLVIRGISTEARSIGQETGVGVYLDGVYTGRAETYNQRLPDIAQVEFLRGPQGTIFGKNTIAGAISLTTIKPSDEIAGSLSLDGGNYGHAEAVGFLSGPLKEGVLFGKIAAYGLTEDGYARNEFNGRRAGGKLQDGVRVQLRATPSEKLEVSFSADVNRIDNEPYRAEVTRGTFGNEPGAFTFNEAYKSWEHIDYSGAALTVNYSLDSGHSLTSITAFRKSQWDTLGDETSNGFNHAWAEYEQSSDYASQELRLASPSGEKLDYVVGLYYSNQKSDTHTPVFIGDGLADIFGIPYGWKSFDQRADVTTDGYAAFANMTYHFAERWAATVGGRYTYEQKDLNFQQFDPNGLGFVPNIGPLTDDYSAGEFTPTASLMYSLNPSWNLYATYSSGYKSGGFNVDVLSTPNNIGFNAERVDNFELGAKAVLFDGRAQANVAVFYMDYKDLQVTQYDPTTFANYIGNAASASVSGIEFDLVAQPTPHLNISAGLGLLDASFDRFLDQYGVDLKGNDLPFAPSISASLATEYNWSISSAVGAFVRVEGAYRDRTYPDVQNDPRNQLESYTLLNARAGLRLGDGWTLEVYGRNLTDELYAVNRTTQRPLLSFLPPFAYDETTTTFGAPRTYGVKLTTRF